MTMTPLETVEAVARLRESWVPVRCDFRLAPCGGCGGPSFQSPCSLCGHHPNEAGKGRWYPPRASAEYFAATVDRSGLHRAGGNLATWHTRSLQRSLRPPRSRGATPADAAVDALLARAQALRGLSPARDVYDAVARAGATLGRAPDPAHETHWDALEACMAAAAEARARPAPPDARAVDALMSRMQDVVSAIHADDDDAARAALEACHPTLAAVSGTGTGATARARAALDAATGWTGKGPVHP